MAWKLDLYPKAIDSVTLRTRAGGALTVGSGVIMLLLFLSEFAAYRTVSTEERLGVDTSDVNASVPLSFSITFPSLPCGMANLDMENALGKHAIALEAGVRHIPFVEESVRRAEPARFRVLTADNAPGCTVEATVSVPKTAGDFHIALGKQAMQQQHSQHSHHVHAFSMDELRNFNASHFINDLSFGEPLPRRSDPLTGQRHVVDGVGQFKYFLKVVPTTLVPLWSGPRHSYQYSATLHTQDVKLGGGSFPHPGVFVKYEFSPLRVTVTQRRPSFLHFVTSVCAIVGGVFTVAGLLDGVVHRSANALKKMS